MKNKKLYYYLIILFFLLIILLLFNTNKWCIKKLKGSHRIFSTSFENLNDFKDFYIVPKNYKWTSSHSLSSEVVHSWHFSHKAWVYKSNEPSSLFQNNNHRWYPTIQLYKTKKWPFISPCYIKFWVWVDADLKAKKPENEWLSFATITSDESDSWDRTILVNLSYDWFVHLMHVPEQWKSERIFQTNNIKFPMKKWVEIKIFIDLSEKTGYAKVWQDWELVSYANVKWWNQKLAQAHFWLYSAPSISKMVIYNDDLSIEEVEKE